MPETIYIEFDKNDLPKWAQRYEEVVWFCERNLSFRGDVFDANTTQYKRFLLRTARRWYAIGDDEDYY